MDVALLQRDGGTTRSAFELLRSVNGRAWDASPVVLRQIEGIGEKSIKVLAGAGLSTLESLAQANPRRVEMLLSRNAPFGNKIVAAARSLPSFHLSVEQMYFRKLSDAVEVSCSITVGLKSSDQLRFTKRETNVPFFICCLTVGSDNSVSSIWIKQILRDVLSSLPSLLFVLALSSSITDAYPFVV